MLFPLRSGLRVLAPAALILLAPALAAAESYERPPSFNAAQIRGIKRVGSNYTILTPVRSDGLLRIYVLKTPYGRFTVQGDEMMRMRQNELYALARMEKMTTSEAFGKALAEAGLSPVMFAGKLITNPVDTVQNTFAGVGNFFGRLGAGMNNAGKTQDDALSGLLGVTDKRREIATAYGVDPYTDFPPLAEKLQLLSQAAATGGLVVTGAMMAVPGGAGIIVSNLSTAYKLNDMGLEALARNYDAAQIMDINRASLHKMGVGDAVTEQFLLNRHYTPIDAAALVAALDSMHGVGARRVYVARAAAANTRSLAYVMRRQAELMADDYHRHPGDYGRFVPLANFPFVVTRDNHVMAVLPIDALSWTRETASGFGVVSAQRKRFDPKARGTLRITGTATRLAKQRMQAEGWTVLEHQRP
jgi:hypothetical protein